MSAIKRMLLGILLMLLGLGFALGLIQAVAIRLGIFMDVNNPLPVVGAIIILVGFIVGLVGFFQKS